MRARHLRALLVCGFACITLNLFAQPGDSAPEPPASKTQPLHRLYWSNSMDAAIFSTSLMQRTGQSQRLTTLRFSYIVNFGFNLNFDFNRHFGLFTGAGVKNIGFIEKFADSTVKRRVYTLGVPLGVRIGDLSRRNFLFLGGGVDVPFNYREKGFVDRGDKEKFNEWFSERTPSFLPYLFAGVSASPGITFKLQYYPGNLLNRDYTTTVQFAGGQTSTYRPYAVYEHTNLLMLSIGVGINYKKHHHDHDREPSTKQM